LKTSDNGASLTDRATVCDFAVLVNNSRQKRSI
jgi:hypothetical protein